MDDDARPGRRAPGRPNPWLTLAVIAMVALIVGGLLISRATRSDPAASAAQTSVDPARFDLPTLTGTGRVRLADFRGKPLVVNFFASWCTACRGELPGMAAVARELKGRVTFAGIDSQENGDGLAMARQYGVDQWPLARDVGGTQDSGLHDALGARGMPLTAFYDSSGRLVSVVFGAITEDDLRSRIHALFGIGA
jgi:thiol-disulfide isomerase/thioredoxin